MRGSLAPAAQPISDEESQRDRARIFVLLELARRHDPDLYAELTGGSL